LDTNLSWVTSRYVVSRAITFENVLRTESISNIQKVGKYFDAIRVDVSSLDSPFDIFPELDTTLDMFQKFLLVGDDRNMSKVFVAGRQVV